MDTRLKGGPLQEMACSSSVKREQYVFSVSNHLEKFETFIPLAELTEFNFLKSPAELSISRAQCLHKVHSFITLGYQQ